MTDAGLLDDERPAAGDVVRELRALENRVRKLEEQAHRRVPRWPTPPAVPLDSREGDGHDGS